jgi:hypothetical protein
MRFPRTTLAQLLAVGCEHRGRVHVLAGADLADLVHGRNDGTAVPVALAEELDLDVVDAIRRGRKNRKVADGRWMPGVS